jgi:hypothetical protein
MSVQPGVATDPDLYRLHEYAEHSWWRDQKTIRQLWADDSATALAVLDRRRNFESMLLALREAMRCRHLTPPELKPELAHIDKEPRP